MVKPLDHKDGRVVSFDSKTGLYEILMLHDASLVKELKEDDLVPAY